MVALIVLGILVVVVLGALIYAIAKYNSLVALRTKIENSYAQIDVQLNRRHDLIPNLVETVKGYASHESGTLEAVTAARNMAVGAQGAEAQAEAENVLSGALKSLFAVSEAYPDLKANQGFQQLQSELSETEDRIAYSRQYYNDVTRQYNEDIQQFPAVIIANAFNFDAREYFEVEAASRANVQVDFDT